MVQIYIETKMTKSNKKESIELKEQRKEIEERFNNIKELSKAMKQQIDKLKRNRETGSGVLESFANLPKYRRISNTLY